MLTQRGDLFVSAEFGSVVRLVVVGMVVVLQAFSVLILIQLFLRIRIFRAAEMRECRIAHGYMKD